MSLLQKTWRIALAGLSWGRAPAGSQELPVGSFLSDVEEAEHRADFLGGCRCRLTLEVGDTLCSPVSSCGKPKIALQGEGSRGLNSQRVAPWQPLGMLETQALNPVLY